MEMPGWKGQRPRNGRATNKSNTVRKRNYIKKAEHNSSDCIQVISENSFQMKLWMCANAVGNSIIDEIVWIRQMRFMN